MERKEVRKGMRVKLVMLVDEPPFKRGDRVVTDAITARILVKLGRARKEVKHDG